MTPWPLMVVQTGAWSHSASAITSGPAWEWLAPPPVTMTGRRAPRRASATRARTWLAPRVR